MCSVTLWLYDFSFPVCEHLLPPNDFWFNLIITNHIPLYLHGIGMHSSYEEDGFNSIPAWFLQKVLHISHLDLKAL